MRRVGVFVVGVFVLLLAVPASAQDYPKGEIFAGISYANVDDPIDPERENFFGFQTNRLMGVLQNNYPRMKQLVHSFAFLSPVLGYKLTTLRGLHYLLDHPS